jgi:hypothetical protein
MTTKLLLTAIALGLWTNAVIELVRPAGAQSDASLSSLVREISSVAHDFHSLVNGIGDCRNQKLCS